MQIPKERSIISKQIQNLSRKLLREYNDAKITSILSDFSDLGRLSTVPMYPVTRTENTIPIESALFSKALEKVYHSDRILPEDKISTPLDVCPFSIDELLHVLKKMRNGKSADTSNIVIEMIKYAGDAFHSVLLGMYNQILLDGCVPEKWHITVFRMLPKSGNLNNVSNWRSIAILRIL